MSAPATPPPAPRSRSFADAPEQARRAAELLLTPNALLPLTLEDAAVVVTHMRLVSFAAGTVLMREGDQKNLDHMLLVLDGEVAVSVAAGGGGEAVPISVMGPGSLIGEMALLDGSPRSSTCIAVSAVQAAGMSRRALELLIDRHPAIASRLMVGLCCRLADRLRAMSDQLKLYASMTGG
ncbi:MAG: Crp/Fnr family transcriptional regulator [Aquabacterium sp.]